MSENSPPAHVRDPAMAGAATKADLDALAHLHNGLVDSLSQLDRLGEHVAAAYLAAAIDVLDERLVSDGRPIGDRHGGIVADFAQRLAGRLGPRAMDVARAQLARADGNTLVVWTAIVNQLERGED